MLLIRSSPFLSHYNSLSFLFLLLMKVAFSEMILFYQRVCCYHLGCSDTPVPCFLTITLNHSLMVYGSLLQSLHPPGYVRAMLVVWLPSRHNPNTRRYPSNEDLRFFHYKRLHFCTSHEWVTSSRIPLTYWTTWPLTSKLKLNFHMLINGLTALEKTHNLI